MPRFCQHPEATPGCPLCVKYDTDPKYRAFWDSLDPAAVARHGPGADQTPARRPLALLPPCKWQGDEVPGCKTCGGEGGKLYYCDHPDDETGEYDRCSRGLNNGSDPLIRSCLTCAGYSHPAVRPVRTFPAWSYVTTAELIRDTLRLTSELPPDIDCVVGVARSGMLPASVVATAMHLPLLSVSPLRPELVGAGAGLRMRSRLKDVSPPKHVVIVDDTVARGVAMGAAVVAVRKHFPDAQITRVAVYASPVGRPHIDFCAGVMDGWHFWEWNWANAGHAETCGFDFDGILCHDCPAVDDDDGPRYARFLRDTKPLFLPRRAPVPLIVTARHEKYRAETLEWLARHGVEVKSLVMRDFEYDREQGHALQIGTWKAIQYDRSELRLFAESDPRQAAIINQLTGRPVLCPAAGKVFPPKR